MTKEIENLLQEAARNPGDQNLLDKLSRALIRRGYPKASHEPRWRVVSFCWGRGQGYQVKSDFGREKHGELHSPDQLLDRGWEPFSVAFSKDYPTYPIYYFRKRG